MNTQFETRTVNVAPGLTPNNVMVKGQGAPLVFLHGPFGQEWTPFLDSLAQSFQVFAPANPGAEDLADLEVLDDIHDLVLYYDTLIENLGLEGPFHLVGHSYGGMVAAEYAAAYPKRIGRLVLIDAMGLWRDDAPVNEFVTVAPEVLAKQMWYDPKNPYLLARAAQNQDLEAAQAEAVKQFVALASAAHFCFPIPERGLHKRLHRISSNTLVIWGEQDGLVPPVYASEFGTRISNASAKVLEGAAHCPHIEQCEATVGAVQDFLR